MSHDCRTFAIAVAAVIASLSGQPAFAQGAPWIAEPGTGTICFTYANQSAKEFWRPVDGTVTKVTGPLGPTGASLAVSSRNKRDFSCNRCDSCSEVVLPLPPLRFRRLPFRMAGGLRRA